MKVRYLFSLMLVFLLTLLFTPFEFPFSVSNTAVGADPSTGSESSLSLPEEQPVAPAPSSDKPVPSTRSGQALSSGEGPGTRFDSKKWPIDTGAAINSSPVLGDLDGDGSLEIVIGSDSNKVYAWKADGTPLPRWPVSTGDSVRSSPALADLDGDGKLDVLVGSFDGKLYAWNFRGNLIKGWPATTGSVIYSSPAVGDVDGDQAPEVIAGSFDNKVYAWNGDGTLLRGWPQPTGLFVYSSPALADLDGDGLGSGSGRGMSCPACRRDGFPFAMFHLLSQAAQPA
ncbi:MAG: VCBS repeat-containing protein, partial [Nitrospira sp.]|nr:VCBS repeat-containing protein [Nitrospira sp.]